MPQAYSTRFDAAVVLAVDAFRHQFRKSTSTPYIAHLFAVCALVARHGGDEDQLIAAILHDYLEDIPGSSPEHLEQTFGREVTAMVLALSDTTSPETKEDWWVRKRRYIERIRHSSAQVKLIAAADKLHNCRAVLASVRLDGDASFDRFTTGKHGTVWYYRTVADALSLGWSSPLLDELLEAVAQLDDV